MSGWPDASIWKVVARAAPYEPAPLQGGSVMRCNELGACKSIVDHDVTAGRATFIAIGKIDYKASGALALDALKLPA